eukprot:Awhi_evm1s10487
MRDREKKKYPNRTRAEEAIEDLCRENGGRNGNERLHSYYSRETEKKFPNRTRAEEVIKDLRRKNGGGNGTERLHSYYSRET